MFKNICVYGIGGVGGYYGGKMAYSLMQSNPEDRNITFIARGKHLKNIQEKGLILNTSEKQGITCITDLAVDSIKKAPVPEICFICVKSYSLNDVLYELKNKINDDTILIPLLNGIDIYERVRKILKTGIVLPSTIYVGSNITDPGVVTQKGKRGNIISGVDPENNNFSSFELKEFFIQMDIDFYWEDDPYPAIWEKYLFIAAFALVTASSGKTLARAAKEEDTRAETEAIMKEVLALADVKGIKLPDDVIEKAIEKAGKFGAETKTSFQRDVEIKGKKNEGDLFGSTIIRMGKEFGIPTPAAEAAFSKL